MRSDGTDAVHPPLPWDGSSILVVNLTTATLTVGWLEWQGGTVI